ncbi:PqqD family protein [Viridibacillus arvi]|uniref:PqqD family protein n=1 Tax=Viridibacillus arvi TaxID=263475 RepID=UPI0034CF1835
MNVIYTPSVNFRVRNIGPKTFLFGEGVAYSLNETGSFIWDNLDGLTSVDEIVELTLEKYNCSQAEAKEGVNNFLEFLYGIKAIKSE